MCKNGEHLMAFRTISTPTRSASTSSSARASARATHGHGCEARGRRDRRDRGSTGGSTAGSTAGTGRMPGRRDGTPPTNMAWTEHRGFSTFKKKKGVCEIEFFGQRLAKIGKLPIEQFHIPLKVGCCNRCLVQDRCGVDCSNHVAQQVSGAGTSY